MPRAKRRCSKPGCRNFHPCDIHPWGWSSTRTGASQSEPLPGDWDQRKRAVKERQRCEWVEQGSRCPLAGTEVDHIIPRFEWPKGKPGVHDIGNLQLLCSGHHKTKTNEEKKRAIKRRWGKQ